MQLPKMSGLSPFRTYQPGNSSGKPQLMYFAQSPFRMSQPDSDLGKP